MLEKEIAICEGCNRILAKGDDLPRPTETTMYCLDCGTLSRNFYVKEVQGAGYRVGEVVEE